MGILRFPWKSVSVPAEPVIGILAFEVAGLMSKVVNLWHSLSEKEVLWLREQIADSKGVRQFVSDDDNHLMDLALEEIIQNFVALSRSVARLGKRCKDPIYHRLEEFFKDPARHDLICSNWQYKWKKMERKVKKMERFVAATMQLSHEEDVLVELEQTLRRMQINAHLDRVKLLEFQQKVMWQRQEVKNLRAVSPWGRTYLYIVRLMARSLFTILERLKLVFGVNQEEGKDYSERRNSDCFPHAHAFPVHPSGANSSRFFSDTPGAYLSFRREKFRHSKSKRIGGSFSGCMMTGSQSTIVGGSMRLVPSCTNHRENGRNPGKLSLHNNIYMKLSKFNSNSIPVNTHASGSTLGHAGLALQYANVIILIEKLSSSPHLISPDARVDLYNMLTTTIRATLRAKLKSYAKTMGVHVYNPALAVEWHAALGQILEMLAPLAHNTMRWHSEQNIEKQNEVLRTNVLLFHTLYHANQARTEAAITELLIGLNYVSRVTRVSEVNMIREHAPP